MKDILSYKKPSLVVMGTRVGTELQSNPNSHTESERRHLAKPNVSGMMMFLFRSMKNIVGGVILFIRSIFSYPVTTRDNHRNE